MSTPSVPTLCVDDNISQQLIDVFQQRIDRFRRQKKTASKAKHQYLDARIAANQAKIDKIQEKQ